MAAAARAKDSNKAPKKLSPIELTDDEIELGRLSAVMKDQLVARVVTQRQRMYAQNLIQHVSPLLSLEEAGALLAEGHEAVAAQLEGATSVI
jgi:hypothetical protein